MKPIVRAERMKPVHSDIRGPLFVEAMKRQKQGIDILKLNTGNPATFGFGLPDSIKNALMEHMQDGVGYCDFKGMPQARQAICDYETSKGIKGITPDDVFIGNGVSEVVSFALTPLLNDGDEVLVPSPSYSLWGNSVYLEDGKPVFYTCDEQANWYPDIQDIRSKITDKTKAIVIINPNNPTGVLYPKEILLEIIQVAREFGLLIFADEIYDRLVMDGKHLSCFTDRGCSGHYIKRSVQITLSVRIPLRMDGHQRSKRTDRRLQTGHHPVNISASVRQYHGTDRHPCSS